MFLKILDSYILETLCVYPLLSSLGYSVSEIMRYSIYLLRGFDLSHNACVSD
jgi:hypothetical protein